MAVTVLFMKKEHRNVKTAEECGGGGERGGEKRGKAAWWRCK